MSQPSSLQRPELPAIGIVEKLAAEDRDILCSYGAFQFLQPGEVLIEQGSQQESLYLVLHGELHAVRRDEGREILLGLIRQGESIGEVNIFDPGTASATVRAVSMAQIWHIDRAALNDFFQVYAEASVVLTVRIASILSRRLRGLSEKLEDKVEYDILLSELGGNA